MIHEFIGLCLADACVFKHLAVAVFIRKGALYVFKDHLISLVHLQLWLIHLNLLFFLFLFYLLSRWRFVSLGVEVWQSKPINVLVLLRSFLYVFAQLLEVLFVRFASTSVWR